MKILYQQHEVEKQWRNSICHRQFWPSSTCVGGGISFTKRP